MNKEEIIGMAREAGFEELFKDSHDWVCFTDEIERFFKAAYAAGAAAAVEREREACAKVCDDLWQEDGTAYDCREAIRARGQA